MRTDLGAFRDLKREARELGLVGVLFGSILLAWVILFGWRPGFLISGNDGILGTQPNFRDFIESGGRWDSFLYHYAPLGGAPGHDLIGFSPLHEWLVSFGLSHYSLELFLGFFVQLVFAYFGLLIFESLRRIAGNKDELPMPFRVLVGVGCAFQPYLAWRIYYGHELILQGLAVFVVFLASFLSFHTARMTLTGVLFSLLALCTAFSSSGQQLILYGAVFGFPILLGLFLDLAAGKDRASRLRCSRSLFTAIALSLTALLLVSDRFASMLVGALGAGAARSLGAGVLTYSYVTADVSDFWSSLPASLALNPPLRPFFFWHEVNYGLGAAVLLLLLLARKQLPRLMTGMLVSFGLAWAFAADFEPVSRNLLRLVPPLASFRVPHRAVLPFASLLFPLASWVAFSNDAWISRLRLRPWVLASLFLIGGFLLVRISVPGLELVVWIAALGALFARQKGTGSRAIWAGAAWIGVLIFGWVGFLDRAVEPIPIASVDSTMHGLRQKILMAAPELQNPLNRSKLRIDARAYGMNLGHALGLSTIEGATFPMAGFSRLASALGRVPYDPTRIGFAFDERSPEWQALRQIYHVENTIHLEAGVPVVKKVPGSAGAAWIPARVTEVGDWDSLADTLLEKRDRLGEALRQESYVLRDSSGRRAGVVSVATAIAPDCSGAKVIRVDARYSSQTIELRAEAPAGCLLVVSVNHTSKWRAQTEDGETLETLPVLGAVTGIRLGSPADRASRSWSIRLEPGTGLPGWLPYLKLFGALLMMIWFYPFLSISRHG